MTTNSIPNKVRWEAGDGAPDLTTEIHSDEGVVIGYVFPRYLGLVLAAPDLLAALKEFQRLGNEWLETLPEDRFAHEFAVAAGAADFVIKKAEAAQ